MQDAEQCQVQLHRNAALSHIVVIAAQRMACGGDVPRGGQHANLEPKHELRVFHHLQALTIVFCRAAMHALYTRYYRTPQ